MCHLLIAVPVAGLGLFYFFPFGLALTIYLPTAGISLFLLLLVVKAHCRPTVTGRESMVGECADAISDLGPTGKISFQGLIWDARSETPVRQGERVIITGFQGLKALVRKRESQGVRP